MFILQVVTDGNNAHISESDCNNHPLSESEVESITRNFFNLTYITDVTTGLLLAKRFSRNCISEEHRAAMCSAKAHEQGEILMEIIQRRSFRDFLTFLECLRDPDIGQSHVADILTSERGGKYNLLFNK